MHIVIINGSPRKNGATAGILHAFEQALSAQGAAVDFLDISDLNIAPCSGCMSCYQTGVCCIKDDGDRITEQIGSAAESKYENAIHNTKQYHTENRPYRNIPARAIFFCDSAVYQSAESDASCDCTKKLMNICEVNHLIQIAVGVMPSFRCDGNFTVFCKYP